MDGGVEDIGGGDREVEGGTRHDLGRGEGKFVTEGAWECPERVRGAREESREGAKVDGQGGSWEDVREVYPQCAWGISCMLLLLLFAYFNFVLYLCCIYDAKIDFFGSTQPYKFKLVGNSRECSWESYGWYKHERKFFCQPVQYWNHTTKTR